jgi:glycosyltransferase involved in cell wall biosynthesis
MLGPVNWFTPLPPARNGIADYSAMLLAEMAGLVPCACYCEEPRAVVPSGVELRDPRQSFRHIGPDAPILHQIGNNAGHVFVLEALRRHGGVVSLHDLSLLYLYELASPRLETILRNMQNPARELGELYARHWKEASVKTAANYVLFDMAGEVLRLARSVIVHSEYARRKLVAVHGQGVAERIAVIPHFAPPLKAGPRAASRQALGIGDDEILILTAGFATKVKRFDWLLDALHALQRQGRSFRWIHAGEERAAEYDLTTAIAARPGLGALATITGFVSEEVLDTHIAAADIVVNLRFPSVGESSGTLARAFAAGTCCIVNDTAAYAEIPRDVALHVPVFGTAGALTAALSGLIDAPDLRRSFGDRARLFAETTLSIAAIARRYRDVVAQAYRTERAVSPPAPGPAVPARMAIEVGPQMEPLPSLLGRAPGPFELILWYASADHFAAEALRRPELLRAELGPHLAIRKIEFVARESGVAGSAGPPGAGALGLAISGTVH